MANQVLKEKIDQFKQDVAFLKTLGISRSEIADRMGMNKSNFSNYYKGKPPITEEFLAKFYRACNKDLKMKAKKKGPEYNTDPIKESLIEEAAENYDRRDLKEEYIDTLKKNNDTLLRSLDEMVKGHLKLINSNAILAETNKKLVDAHSPGSPPSPEKPGDPPAEK